MKQKHERKVTRFLITMAVALLVGGICGYLGAMYASSFSGVLAGLGMVLGYAAPVLAALAVCIGCLMARRAYQKAQRLSQSGSDEDVLAALDTLDACIIALETQSMVSLFLGAFSQRRVIELVKCLCPEKRGDTMDKNFTREWYESCDEAERARIGFAAYKSFLATQHGFVAAIVVLILLSIATPVGWPAFAAVGTLWFVQKFTYFAHARQRAEK